MKKNKKCAHLAQEFGFGSTLLHHLSWLVQGTGTICHLYAPVEKSVMNKI
jgi:hypothetical protein